MKYNRITIIKIYEKKGMGKFLFPLAHNCVIILECCVVVAKQKLFYSLNNCSKKIK